MSKNDFSWLKYITEIQAIAQNGLTYSTNEFDKERYLRLREIAAECMAYYSDSSLAEIKEIFSIEKGYATPKIDVRAFILQNNKLLLVKERADGLWTLPGGWAETNESAAESVIREAKEETGFDVSVIRLLALWDKQKHEHPLQWPHTYKCFFHCEIMSGEAQENLEIAEIDFFDPAHLPPLSTPRVTSKQITRLYELVYSSDKTLFD
ncbi:NUDIX hydrolase [Fluoribacter dumoffii]|uniref:Bifunctional nicotinamide mononucleotide adenylyltransferase/ADP-ribose pyrophosphatase n=1 Tax=Fluoribacter dumoffii TaxID=463 RepID=A0A377GDQ4_9GAMM|nr:NUDIX hydrolase [Fluoribacter dumoffii]KTC90850.1 Mutator MutT protein [Fluoribacter dumoffii NY 23]MCW8386695.1 NUDIX hydrolase [Fluoribacter dumoffii]MCW8419750.1 NUDIX hydrolase [Fluoribacter dumoffii]MCW8455548.1 NUDIX hydrolase [Fluoribacter dumoffii]MCW8460373.1 NUDIX hydrolase [Fluoribacter dumoffii]